MFPSRIIIIILFTVKLNVASGGLMGSVTLLC